MNPMTIICAWPLVRKCLIIYLSLIKAWSGRIWMTLEMLWIYGCSINIAQLLWFLLTHCFSLLNVSHVVPWGRGVVAMRRRCVVGLGWLHKWCNVLRGMLQDTEIGKMNVLHDEPILVHAPPKDKLVGPENLYFPLGGLLGQFCNSP